MRKTIYCTLDTETVGGASTPTGMYNLGCVIHDNQGNIFATTSMLVMEHYDKIKKDSYGWMFVLTLVVTLIDGAFFGAIIEGQYVTISTLVRIIYVVAIPAILAKNIKK